MATVALWIALNDAPNAAAQSVLCELGCLTAHDCGQRPRACLDLRDGELVVGCAAPAELLRRVRDSGDAGLVALSTLDAPTCRGLHGRSFVFNAERCSIEWQQERVEALPQWEQPYARRMFRLRHGRAVEIARSRHESVLGGVESGIAPLFVDPLCAQPGEAELGVLDIPGLIESSNALFLPPVRTEAADTFFARELRDLRRDLRAAVGAKGADQTTLAEQLAAATDDAALRDVFLDGGSLHVHGVDGGSSECELVLQTAGRSGYRARFFGEASFGRSLIDGEIARLWHALRSDLTGHVVPRTAVTLVARRQDPGLDWRVPWLLRDHTASHATGTWDNLRRLRDRVWPAQTQRERNARFDLLVTLPTRPSGSLPADNDGAERRFVAHCWRCPWSIADDTWHSVALDLVGQDGNGFRVDPHVRVDGWRRRSAWLRLRDGVLEHSFAVGDPRLLELRLLLPPGTRFRRRGVLRFDDPLSHLDLAVLG